MSTTAHKGAASSTGPHGGRPYSTGGGGGRMRGTTEPDEEHVCPGADGLEFIGFRPDH